MCGLVGIAGDISHLALTVVFKDLLDVSQVRGRDSAGVIKVDESLDYDWVKQAGSAYDLYTSRKYEQRIEKGTAVALIGHTRSKTVGDVSFKNAHPFDYPDEGIVGVHNGTLRNYTDLEGYSYSKVDSDVLYNHLAVHGPDETFDRLQGAYACVWWDNNTKLLNFIRNAERPLWFCWSKDGKMLFWASEKWMFSVIARKIDLWIDENNNHRFLELPVHTLWQFKVKSAGTKEDPPVVMKQPKKIEFLAPVVKKPHAFGYSRIWAKNDQGDWNQLPDKTKGGEVINPFLSNQAHLNDPLPDFLAEAQNTQINNVSFLKTSAHTTEPLTGKTFTKKSKKAILSLPPKNLTNIPPANKGECSGNTTKCHDLPQTKAWLRNTGVSRRCVAGLQYITDNRTKKEYEQSSFLSACGGKCCFCQTNISSIWEVGEIIDDTNFVCTACLKETSVSISATN